MRWSKTFIPTLKEDPQDAEAASHKLMVRAGLIRRLTAGAYSYLPLGYRILKKTEQIIREEMDRAGAIELLLPALQPVELWKKTGRYDVIGDVMIKFVDRHGRETALGPTHEEIITDMVSREVRSYKDLPLIFYQIQNKFRDELRPRFGVVRSCEFIMKDAYSFDEDTGGMEASYKKMYDAYCRIFERCGLPYIAVEADPGLMGGAVSHEFMVPSEIGEDKIVLCRSCGYAASTEVAAVKEAGGAYEETMRDKEEVKTPGRSSVDDVSDYLKVDPSKIIKTLVYIADGKAIAVLLSGEHEANEAKIKRQLGINVLELADEKRVIAETGGAMGFSGPVGMKLPAYADFAVKKIINAVTGSNRKDSHLVNVNYDRDYKVDRWIDARCITESDPCPACGKKIDVKNAVEIGHTFKLGTKYSESLNARFLDENGREMPVIMGCYGIGVNRILAALIETSHDEKGIIWPFEYAPFSIVVIPVNKEDEEVVSTSQEIYEDLLNNGYEAIIDDRMHKSAGVKFKDADLVGFPLQIIVGKKSLENGKIEIKSRKTDEKFMVEKGKIMEMLEKVTLKQDNVE